MGDEGRAVFGLQEAGEYLSIDRETVRLLILGGEFPARRARGRWYIARQAIDDWLLCRDPRALVGERATETAA